MITYKEAVAYLLDIPKFTKKKNENNLKNILASMGNPERNMKVIHVAGTNGKGSSCAFVNNILRKAGYRVGMFTSPHLVKINERIKIDGEDISDDAFLQAFIYVKERVDALMERGGEHPSFFEYIFLVGVTALKNAGVEYGIFEVGLGGRLDATNVIEKPVVSIIASVSMDHMEILGDTIDKIASEKAGIIKREVPVIYYSGNKTVADIIRKQADKVGTESKSVEERDIKIVSKNNKSIDFCIVNSYDKYCVLSIPFVMEYQTVNAALAVAAVSSMVERHIIDVSSDHIREGLLATRWPGRMEQISEHIYIDGAHNYDGVLKFKDFVNELTMENDATAYVLFSVVKEKEYYQMMNLIEQIDRCKGFLVAPVKNARAAAVSDLACYLKKSGKPVYTFDSLPEAFDYGKNLLGQKDYLFCVGSLYMVGEIKEYLEA